MAPGIQGVLVQPRMIIHILQQEPPNFQELKEVYILSILPFFLIQLRLIVGHSLSGVLADNTTVVNGDYDGFSGVLLANNLSYASIGTPGRNNWTLNTVGKNYISKTSFTVLFLRDSNDFDIITPTHSASNETYINPYGVSHATTSNRPFLEMVYTSGATPPVASFTLSKNFLRIPNSVTATDTSTNVPTSWEWSWGDGTANSTTQNPSHQYVKRGKWDIVLTATNAGGSGTTGATSVKVTGYENYYN
jgi:PKD repeat protein